MCTSILQNVRFSKQRGGERTPKRAWTCLHVWCVKLTEVRTHEKRYPAKEKMSTSRNTTLWKGQISCWVKKIQAGEAARCSSQALAGGWTYIYNYRKYPVFCLRGALKHIFAFLYLEILTSKITENEKHEWGRRGGTTTRKHNHNKQACVHFESTHAISQSTSINTNTQQGLICAALPVDSQHIG